MIPYLQNYFVQFGFNFPCLQLFAKLRAARASCQGRLALQVQHSACSGGDSGKGPDSELVNMIEKDCVDKNPQAPTPRDSNGKNLSRIGWLLAFSDCVFFLPFYSTYSATPHWLHHWYDAI